VGIGRFQFVVVHIFHFVGWSVVLMFLLWNLYYLALVSGVLWVAVIVTTYAVMHSMSKRLGWSIIEELRA